MLHRLNFERGLSADLMKLEEGIKGEGIAPYLETQSDQQESSHYQSMTPLATSMQKSISLPNRGEIV